MYISVSFQLNYPVVRVGSVMHKNVFYWFNYPTDTHNFFTHLRHYAELLHSKLP